MKRCSIACAALAILLGAACARQDNKRIIYPSTPPAEGTVAPAAASSRAWTFDDAAVDQLPAGWRVAETHSAGNPAAWSVLADAAAPSPPHVLAIVRSANKGSTYNLALLENTAYQDLDLSVKVKALSGREDQGGGPVWRCRDADNYYICRWNPLEDNFRVYKVVNGRRQQLASADTDADAGAWRTIRVIMKGSRLECHLDGQKLLEASDDALQDSGMVGLWTKADAATAFDDLSVTEAR